MSRSPCEIVLLWPREARSTATCPVTRNAQPTTGTRNRLALAR